MVDKKQENIKHSLIIWIVFLSLIRYIWRLLPKKIRALQGHSRMLPLHCLDPLNVTKEWHPSSNRPSISKCHQINSANSVSSFKFQSTPKNPWEYGFPQNAERDPPCPKSWKYVSSPFAPQFYRGCFEGVTCTPGFISIEWWGTSADLNSQGYILLM